MMKEHADMLMRALCAVLVLVLCLGAIAAAAPEESGSEPAPEASAAAEPAESPQPEQSPEPEAEATEEPAATDEPEAEATAEPLPTLEPTPVIAIPPVVYPSPEVTAAPAAAALTEDVQAYAEEQLGTDLLEDPLYYKLADQVAPVAITAKTYSDFTPRALKSGETLHKGIDVSSWQHSINWKSAAADGVEFVIIRAGYRGSTDGKIYVDSYFAQNIAGAKAAGLKVGVYVFSQAVTVAEAKAEAQFLVKMIQDYGVDLPLAFDYEETTNSNRRLKMSSLDRQLKTDICNAFCKEVEDAGYESMVYSNPSTLNNHLYRNKLGRLWLAHFTAKTDHSSPYEFWQCGYGQIKGISGDVDLDFWFAPGTATSLPSDGAVSATPDPDATPSPTPDPDATPSPEVTPTATPAPTPSATPAPAPVVTNPFSDVKKSDWCYDSVLWAYGKKIVNGVSSTSFSPYTVATRGQLVAMLYRMEGQPPVTGSSSFTDLKEDYYKKAVAWASANGVVNGFSETQFGPNGKITREQLATMLYRMAGSPYVSGSLSSFKDGGSVQSYARDAMIWAVEEGVVTGYPGGEIRPGASASRAEVCTMLMRYFNL